MRDREHGAAPVRQGVAAIAERQRGVVTHRQLRSSGVAASTIQRWRESGLLHTIHRGVYLAGHEVAPEGALEVAALLACPPGGAISHRSAARWWKLRTFITWSGPVAVTTTRRRPRPKAGVQLYTTDRLQRGEVRTRDGIRVTAPARTLLDIAAVAPLHQLETSIADARAARMVGLADLERTVDRHPGRRGAGALRHVLALARQDDGSRPTRSEAERRFLSVVRQARLPRPQTNSRVERFTVDAVWPAHKLIVEVDGFAFHSDPTSFERDRARDATLVARGYAVTRVTWRQITAAPLEVAARLAGALTERDPGRG